MAHIERYDYLSLDDYYEISKYALIQVNSKSFFEKDYKKTCILLLKNNLIDFIASDCHNIKRDVEFKKTLQLIKKKNIELYNKIISNDIS